MNSTVYFETKIDLNIPFRISSFIDTYNSLKAGG